MVAKEFSVKSGERTEFIDITAQIRNFVKKNDINDGKITVFVPHTTAAVTINENADPNVRHDLKIALDEIASPLPNFTHMEGNSDAHFRSSIFGCSEIIIVKNGKLLLGTWQGVYFCEFDGPRKRRFVLSA